MTLTPPLTSVSSRPRICILGGGFGGLYSALSLAKYPMFRDWQILLVDREDRFLFTPLLYELMTGELETWEIAPPYLNILQQTAVEFYRDTVEAVDLSRRQVQLRDRGSLQYDYLILGLGVRGIRPPHPEVLGFRTLADAQRLEAELQRLQGKARPRIAVIGGGPSGVELAGKLGDRLQHRGDIHLLDRTSPLLKPFTAASRRSAHRALEQRGVRVSLDTAVTNITGSLKTGFTLTLEQQGEPLTLPTDLVVWTAGTQVSELGRSLECPHSDRGKCLVTPTLQLRDRPEVFVLGDLAEIEGGNPLPDTAQVVYQQAGRAAANLRSHALQHHPGAKRSRMGTKRSRSPRPFRYLHLGEMMTLGISNGVVDSFGIHINGKLGNLIRRLVYTQRLPTLKHSLRVLWHEIKRIFYRKKPQPTLTPLPAPSSTLSDTRDRSWD